MTANFFRAFAGLVTYFIVGSAVGYFHFGKKGISMIPQKDIWFEIPFLVKASRYQ